MKKLLTTLVGGFCGLLFAQAQTTPSGSDYLVARDIPSKTLFYNYSDQGTLMPRIKWGLDLAWCSETNMKQGRNYLNLFDENVSIVRLSFQPAWALSNNGLSTTHLTGTTDVVGLTERLRVLGLLGTKPEIFLNCDPTSLGLNSNFKGTSSNVQTRWVNLIKATGQYVENQGYTVTGIAPFNEPDLSSTGYPNASTMNNIMSKLKSDSWGKSKKLLSGNTLNPDYYTSWYTPCKSNTDEGNTHQLAGSFGNYIGFMQLAKSDGKQLCQDELHNVMEAMVGANYGMNDGIWWGTSEHARTQFCRANDGTGRRLAYMEDSGTFTAASIYHNTQDGLTEAYIGASERQATETSYGFVSRDRDVYYDGYGPTRAFYMHVPADPNGAYQTEAQKTAERVIDIQSGEDVQPFPTVGEFQLLNVGTGKVIQGNTSWTGWSANQATLANGTGADGQAWSIEPVGEDIGGDFSYYTIHSTNGQWWTYYLDDNEWGFEEANPIIQYPGGGSGCEQWYFRYAGDGSFYIHNRYSNLVLDASEGTGLVQRTLTKSNTQRWRLAKADATCDLTAPAAPTGLTATPLLAAVQLSWTANAESDLWGYTIVRTEKGKNDWNTIARIVEGTTYIDNTALQGTEYTYKMKAVDKSCNHSGYSSSVTAAPTGKKGLVARWEFDSNVRDKSENQMNAALHASSYTEDSRSGGMALSLDGSTNYAQLPYTVGTSAALTFCGWVYWNGGSAWQRIFDFGTGEDSYLFLTPSDGSNMKFEIKANGTTQSVTATRLATGAWKHVAVTIEKGNVRLYVDGAQVGSSTSVTLTPADVAGVCNYLGRSQFIADPLLNARLDDVRLYNYILSQSEILAIINEATQTEAVAEWQVGGQYYLYNIEAGQFLTQGNTWGTQASLADEGLLWTVNKGSGSNLYRLSRSGQSNYLYATGIGDMYVDGSSNCDLQMLFDDETGLTTISMAPSNATYGTAKYGTTYVGWNGDLGHTTVAACLGADDHSKPGIHWMLMPAATYKKCQSAIASALAARQAMWPYVQSALADGVVCAERTLYENVNATSAALTAAGQTIAATLLSQAQATASEEKPADLSFLMRNPTCSSAEFDGWTTTGTWSSNTSSHRNGTATLGNRFTEAWVNGWNGETLPNLSLSQQLTGLPEGKYQLALDIAATNQSTRAAVSGVTLALGTASVGCSTTSDDPSTFTTPTFRVGSDGKATASLTVEGTNASWVALDNFRLLYLGNTLVGDVTGDGTLDTADIRAIISILFGTKTQADYPGNADLNNDGRVTLADLTALVNLKIAE